MNSIPSDTKNYNMKNIKIYNTLINKKEFLVPINDNHIGIYVCGITPYDYCHIGHARSAIVFDTITKYLRWKGFEVTLVRNFTDIDDKIIKKSIEQDIPFYKLSDFYHKELKFLFLP